jgi:hypothetical protein
MSNALSKAELIKLGGGSRYNDEKPLSPLKKMTHSNGPRNRSPHGKINILLFRETTIETVQETRKRIGLGITLVKRRRIVRPKYSRERRE